MLVNLAFLSILLLALLLFALSLIALRLATDARSTEPVFIVLGFHHDSHASPIHKKIT
jgi:hypothetical protein